MELVADPFSAPQPNPRPSGLWRLPKYIPECNRIFRKKTKTLRGDQTVSFKKGCNRKAQFSNENLKILTFLFPRIPTDFRAQPSARVNPRADKLAPGKPTAIRAEREFRASAHQALNSTLELGVGEPFGFLSDADIHTQRREQQ